MPTIGGWIIVSKVSELAVFDARGCYPLFCCHNWSNLYKDIEGISKDLVSVVLVTDPFGEFDPLGLEPCFPDLFIPYKEHYIVDLGLPIEKYISNHTARNLKKAQTKIQVEHCPYPLEFSEQWIRLYSDLIKRHNIKGISAFSKTSLLKQLQVPGLEMFLAIHKKNIVGIMLMYIQKEIAYYHLATYNETGYELRASYALMRYILSLFSNPLKSWVCVYFKSWRKRMMDEKMIRIYLRAHELEDYSKIHIWRMDTGYQSGVVSMKRFISSETEKKWVEYVIKRHEQTKEIRLGIALKENDEMIGLVSLTEIDHVNRNAQLNSWIGEVEQRKKGYNHEAVYLLMKYAFFELGLERVSATVLEENIASKKSLEKLGYIQEGFLRNAVFKEGKFQSLIAYSMLKSEFYEKFHLE